MRALRWVTALLALASFWPAAAHSQQTAEELFQAGLYKEEAQGDLEGAIELYRQLVHEYPGNRAVGAKAQLHIGLCLEKLGLAEAQQAYRSVIDDFPEQRQQVETARQRLASLAEELAELRRGPTFTKIEIASRPQNGVLSPDGSRLAFVSGGGVWVMPLHGNVDPTIAGEAVRIADVEGVWGGCSLLAWSRDGRWVAVNGTVNSDDAVYVVRATGGEQRVIHMPPRGTHAYSYRLSLAPDGETLAFSALGPDQVEGLNETQKRFIYSVPVSGGDPRQLTETWGRLPAYAPDGETIAYVSHSQRQEGYWESDLWLMPVSGGEPVKVVSSDSGRIRGPVWSPGGEFIAAHHEPGLNNFSAELWVVPVTSADASSSLTKIALPNTSWNMLAGWTPDDQLGVFMTTPGDAGAAYTVTASGGRAVRVTPEHGGPSFLEWSPDGERIYAVWDAESSATTRATPYDFVGFVPAAGGTMSAVPVPWGGELEAAIGITLSPDGGEIAFMGIEGTDSTVGRRPEPDQMGIWKVGVAGGEPVQLTSGPSYDAFPSWSRDGRWIAILRMTDGQAWNVHVIPAAGGEGRRVTSDADSVTAGRIAFSPDGERIAFFSAGAIRAIPVQGGQAETLVTVGRVGPFPELDWSPDGTRIVHTSEGKTWITRLSDGTTAELATGLSARLRHSSVSWSPDGQRIAFAASMPQETEFWLISDFLP